MDTDMREITKEEDIRKIRAKDLKNLTEKLIGINKAAYKTRTSHVTPLSIENYDEDTIASTIMGGDPAALRVMSLAFYRASGTYQRFINYFSSLLTFDHIVSPVIPKMFAPDLIQKRQDKGTSFVNLLSCKQTFPAITKKTLLEGAYYGLLRVYKDTIVIQDLPAEYCRVRYKNKYGVNLLEFNLKYFEDFRGPELESVLDSFPDEVLYALINYKGTRGAEPWYLVPSYLGMAFFMDDMIPPFINIIPAVYNYENSKLREIDRDSEELEKILVNKMPLNKDNDLIFSIEETEIMHQGLCDMLKNNPYINVLTAYGDVKLEQTQDTSNQAQRDNTKKYSTNVFNEAGLSSELFNSTTGTTLIQSLNKDASFLTTFANTLAHWLTYQLNLRFSDTKMSYSFQILPITVHNRKEMADFYIKGAQFGYSKLLPGIAQGIEQHSLVGLLMYENQVLKLQEVMVPLQSSHTETAKDSKNSNGKTETSDNNSDGGRPEKPSAEVSDSTDANKESQ